MKTLLFVVLTSLFIAPAVQAKPSVASAVESTQKQAESQIRHLLEPLLDKYCHDECKLMNVSATVDVDTPDDIAPGFDDVDPRSVTQLAPSSATIKVLMDEKVGPVSRTKLLELLQQFLDTLEYPVRIETQMAHFPQPVGSAGKVAELREKATKQFRSTVDDLFSQFCPNQCLLADYELQTELINAEEAQYGQSGEFLEDGGVAIRIKNVAATILVDDSLPEEERKNIVEMAKLKTNFFKNVSLTSKNLKFPRPTEFAKRMQGLGPDGKPLNDNNRSIASDNKSSESNTSNSNSVNKNSSKEITEQKASATTSENNARQERFERIEKIERVESGDAVQKELEKFKVYGLIFGCSILSLLIFLAMASYRPTRQNPVSTVQRVIQSLAADPVSSSAPSTYSGISSSDAPSNDDRNTKIAKRYEIERITEELLRIYAEHPKVAKAVFSRVLTEEGTETTSAYMQMFGETIVMDMLRDPSLQADISELMEYHAKNPTDITDDEKLDLLKKLYNRTVTGKLVVMGSRSSHLFDFLADMDGTQILELIRNESLTVKSIVLTQCDNQKRTAIYSHMDEDTRLKLLTELSRIDYLPKDYIFNVAGALKRKRRENPRLNTEALPGSEVLITLLERTDAQMQRTVLRSLESTNPESARVVKGKLVSLDTLRHLPDGQLLEVVLSLKHNELLQFLKGAPQKISETIFAKAPKDLVSDLEDELANHPAVSRESFQSLERKVINRMKLMANEGLISLVETNDRMLTGPASGGGGVIEAGPAGEFDKTTTTNIKKVAGW